METRDTFERERERERERARGFQDERLKEWDWIAMMGMDHRSHLRVKTNTSEKLQKFELSFFEREGHLC
jgi:hypothetical protein